MSDVVDVAAADYWPDDAGPDDEAVVANWFVREGASVEEGDLLCEFQIEKVSVDVTAPVAGTVAERAVGEDEPFGPDAVLVRIRPS